MAFSWVRKDVQYLEEPERRPELDRRFESSVKGLHIVGAAAGSPLLKTCINQGVEVMRCISRLEKPSGRQPAADGPYDVVIVGAGPAGLAAALEAGRRGYSYLLLEKSRPLDTIVNFPAGKHVYAEPASLPVQGELWLDDATKEQLLERWGRELEKVRVELGTEVKDIRRRNGQLEVECAGGRRLSARRVVLAIGRMGNPRRLGVPGQDSPWVFSRLLNPGKVSGRKVLVVGGGNSAVEAVLALYRRNQVVLVHRGDDFARVSKANRRQLEQAEAAGKVRILRRARVQSFENGKTNLEVAGQAVQEDTDLAYVLIGAAPPVAFLRRLGVRFEGNWGPLRLVQLALAFGLVYFVYGVKNGLWPFGGIYSWLAKARVEPGFLYGLLYSVLMSVYGVRALRRWKDDHYQRRRYTTLIAAQWIVYFALPWGLWYLAGYPHYWRLWGVTLVYPLGYYGLWEPAGSLFSGTLLPWALASLAAFLIFMPLFAFFQGKRFCAWFCPCGGLADTVGDAWRQRAPRGRRVRYLEISSSVVFVVTVLASVYLISGYRSFLAPGDVASGYKTVIDVGLASLVAVTLYPFSGGRVWCRFFCPLAKWMEWWGRLGGGRLAIVPNDECISCGECTRYCQMGIDVRSFAQREQPLSNSTTCCIFCGICVSVCPVDVLRLEHRRPGAKQVTSR